MIYICVICMVKRPPLSPLTAEHRTLLEAIVSPIIKTEELKACHCQWLLCANCKLLMQNFSNFQQTALTGIKNLKYLLHKLKTEQTRAKNEHTKPSVTSIKIEPGPVVSISPSAPKEEFITVDAPRNVNPLTEELHVKFEPEVLESEHEPECDSKSTLSCEPGDNGLSNEQPAISVSSITRPVEILPKPATAGSEGVFEVFTHKPLPSKKLPYITSIQWKDGVRDGSEKKVRKKPKRVPCPHCDKSLSEKCKLKTHIRSFHSELAPCKCDVCGRQCRNEEMLKYHKRCHGKKNYKCHICDKAYGQMKAVRRHIVLVHEKTARPTLVCHLCGKIFTIRNSLKEHLLTHEGIRPHQCPLCPANFTYKAALYTHNKLKHLKIKGKWKKKKKKVEKEGKADEEKGAEEEK